MSFVCFWPGKALEPLYQEPEELSTTEGLLSSLVKGSIFAISGEYVDSVVDIAIPGVEPLILKVSYFPQKEKAVTRSGAGNKKFFRKTKESTEEGWIVCSQVAEEKINGSCFRYQGGPVELSGCREIVCENRSLA